MGRRGELSQKQARFVAEYLADPKGNATAAAIRAGYSPKTAYSIASENLKKPEISQIINAAKAASSARTEITADYVLANLKEIAERCMQRAPVVDRRGRQIYDEEGNAIWAFDAKNANRALELLGKYLGLFVEKQKVTLDGGVEVKPVEAYDFTGVPQEDLLELVREAYKEDKGGGEE